MGDLSAVFKLIQLLIIVGVILAIYSIYSFFFKDSKTIKCTKKPTIDYEIKGNGKKIDTVWIYKFK